MPCKCRKGVMVDFDFAAIDGAAAMHKAASSVFGSMELEKEFGKAAEARYFAGRPFVDGARDFLSAVKSRRAPEKTAELLESRFESILAEFLRETALEPVKAFFKAVSGAGLTVAVVSRLEPSLVAQAVGAVPESDGFVFHREVQPLYCGLRRDLWRHVAARYGLDHLKSVAVTGTQAGLKAALMSAVPVAAVVREHVAFMDFGGADVVAGKFDSDLAKNIFALLKL